MLNKPKSLYIHIPFCDHICKYCDFTKLFYFKKYEKPYLISLFNEIDSYHIKKVKTIYIGGGTPTSLSNEGFEILLDKISPLLSKDGEFTCEANIENLTKSKLLLMKKYGVNRLSIGVQSTSNSLLKNIGRFHTWEDSIKVIKMAKKLGFSNINIDLIYGFENETEEMLKNDLSNFIKLDIKHVSIYSLLVNPGSIFYNEGKNEQNEEDSRKQYELIVNFLRKNGFKRYEVSNFAKDKMYSKHNLTYWHNEQYYGVGLGASGYIGNVRYTNTKNIVDYIDGKYLGQKEIINKDSQIEYFLLTNLRLENGFSRKKFMKLFKMDFLDYFKIKIENYKLDKYFKVNKNSISLNDEGLLLMDFIILKLL